MLWGGTNSEGECKCKKGWLLKQGAWGVEGMKINSTDGEIKLKQNKWCTSPGKEKELKFRNC